jgi:hypothetical protein
LVVSGPVARQIQKEEPGRVKDKIPFTGTPYLEEIGLPLKVSTNLPK